MAASSTIENYITRDLVTVTANVPASEAILLLLKHKISGMPVVDETGKLVGILSERDCLKTLVHARYHNLPTTRVADLMTTEVETIGPDADLLNVAELFLNRHFRRLPVIKEGQLVGQISRRDMLRAIEEMR